MVLWRSIMQQTRSSFLKCRHKYTLSFKHDPDRQALIFYTRDPPLARSRLYQDTFEDMFLDMTGAKRLPKIKFQRDIPPKPPLAVPDYRKLNQQVIVSILERMGRMPRRREFTVCVVGKLFYQHQAYRVNFFDNVSNDVRLRPGFLFSKLLGEAFDEEGKMDFEAYRRLKKRVVDNFYVRHGIEVDLRYVPGMAEKRYVVFPRKINRKEIRRSLALTGIRMRLMRLRIIRPNPRSTALTWLKRLPTRCVIFPAGTQRTMPRKTATSCPRVYHPIRIRRSRRYRYEKPLD